VEFLNAKIGSFQGDLHRLGSAQQIQRLSRSCITSVPRRLAAQSVYLPMGLVAPDLSSLAGTPPSILTVFWQAISERVSP
jgi:hypothetical protein